MRVEFLRPYLRAIRSFTRIPLTGALDPGPTDSAQVREAAIHWPGAGVLVGSAAAIVFAACGLLLQDNPFAPLACAVLGTMVSVALTGAAHEEGLLRLAEERGRHGAIVVFMALSGKLALLAVLASQSPVSVLLALPAGHCVSRLVPLHFLSTDSERLPDSMPGRSWVVAIGWCAAPLLVAAAIDLGFAVLGLLAAAGAAWAVTRWLRSRELQRRGEALDLMQQAAELAFYFGAAVGWALG